MYNPLLGFGGQLSVFLVLHWDSVFNKQHKTGPSLYRGKVVCEYMPQLWVVMWGDFRKNRKKKEALATDQGSICRFVMYVYFSSC